MRKSAFAAEYARFRRALVAERVDAGVTQWDLARRIGQGLTQSDVSKIERGERKLNVVEFIYFMRALNRDPAEVIAALDEILPRKRV